MRIIVAAGVAALLASVAGCAGATGVVRVGEPAATRAAGFRRCPDAAELGTAVPRVSAGQTPMNTPQAEELAQAIRAEGETGFADVFGSSIVDYPMGRVALCLTDPAKGRALAAAAERAHPGIDLGRLDVYACRYPERALSRATGRIPVGTRIDGFPIYESAVAPDDSGLQVTTDRPGARSAALRTRLEALAGGIAVSVRAGEPAVPAAARVG